MFTGSVPVEIGNLTELRSISLRSNSLSDPIPYQLGKLKQVRFLDFGKNHRTSPNSARFQSMELELILSGNNFTGSTPHDIGLISGLKTLDLAENIILGGHIPASLGQLQALESLHLFSCGMNFSIPSQLGQFTNLKYLDLGENNITGSLPPSLAALSRNSAFSIALNRITGAILGWIFTNWTNLIILNLLDNSFIGPIPPKIGLFKNLRTLQISLNKFSGHILLEIENLTNLELLDLSSNGSMLVYLNLNGNHLTGSLPPELCNLEAIKLLDLDSNNFQGSIPTSTGEMVNLSVLDLAGNKLMGPIPTALGHLTDLQLLNLSNNKLSGEIPASLRNCSKLKFLDLGENYVIPTIFNNLTTMGTCGNTAGPDKIHKMQALEELDLSNNLLFGEIPSNMSSLTFLGTLNRHSIIYQDPFPMAAR
ncbi:hypothetical protein AMTRI_Chr02g259080 [Amborella trichopoda]